MWKYRDKSVFKREWGDYVDNWIDHNSVSRVAKQWGEIPQLHQAYHYFDEEWLEDDKIITWPSLTKIFSASPALVGATYGILLIINEDITLIPLGIWML